MLIQNCTLQVDYLKFSWFVKNVQEKGLYCMKIKLTLLARRNNYLNARNPFIFVMKNLILIVVLIYIIIHMRILKIKNRILSKSIHLLLFCYFNAIADYWVWSYFWKLLLSPCFFNCIVFCLKHLHLSCLELYP